MANKLTDKVKEDLKFRAITEVGDDYIVLDNDFRINLDESEITQLTQPKKGIEFEIKITGTASLEVIESALRRIVSTIEYARTQHVERLEGIDIDDTTLTIEIKKTQ